MPRLVKNNSGANQWLKLKYTNSIKAARRSSQGKAGGYADGCADGFNGRFGCNKGSNSIQRAKCAYAKKYPCTTSTLKVVNHSSFICISSLLP